MTAPTMQITVDEPGSVIGLHGRLCAATVADVRAALAIAVECGNGDLVVDLADTELSDATGLGVLVSAHRIARRDGRRLVLRDVPDRIDRLLTRTRLQRVLTTESSVAV